MADYYPLIVKAVNGLDRSSGEGRRDLYDRARKALLAQLRGVEPALSEPDITRERLALEEAIRKVEAEAARRSRNDPPPPRPDSSRPDPKRPDNSEASSPEASSPEECGPEIPRPDATVRSEPPLRPARQAVIPQRTDVAAARSSSAGWPAAPLSAAAVRPILPHPDAEGEAISIPEAASGAKPASVERTRWTPGSNGPSISDKGLKGFRDIFSDAGTPGEAPDAIKALAAGSTPNAAVEAAEPRRDSRSDKRSQSRPQPRTARAADLPMEPRTDARSDKRTGRGSDRGIDRGAGEPADEPADRWSAARTEPRINGRSELRGEPRPDSPRPPRKDARPDFLRAGVPSDIAAEPQVEPPALRPLSRRLSARDAERTGREPVVEPRANREALEPRRARDSEPPRFPDELPAHEIDAGEAVFTARSEQATYPPASIVRQEDGRRRAAAPRAAVKPERQPGPARRASTPPGQWKKLAALVITGLLLMTIAAVAVWKRDQLLSPFRSLPSIRPADSAAPAESAKGIKIPDRIGAQPATTQSAADTAPVAQKVVLYEEDQNDPAGKRFVGSAVWRTEQVAPAPGKPPEVTVRADIEIPDQRLGLRWSLRRNDDKALPASHTVEIMFSAPTDFLHGSISNIPGVLMKQGESTRGVPLAGLAVKVTNNFFLIGLSSVEADMQRNIQLLKERSWFDIPVVYSDGKRAIIAIEKGTPGDRAFSDAFAAWGQ